MADIVKGLLNILLLGIIYFLIRGFYYTLTQKKIPIAKRAQGINITSAFLSLLVNIFFIFFWLPPFVWGNFKSMAVYFFAFGLVYLLLKYLILRKKSWRKELLEYEQEWIANFIIALPVFALIAIIVGILLYIGFNAAIYLLAGFVLVILAVAFCPWLLLFFI